MNSHSIHPEQWVARYADYLYNYTIVRVNDHIVAQEIISDTFLAGLKAKDQYKGEASERTWLTAILKRKIIDHYRKKSSQKGKAEVRISYRNDETEGSWLEERVEDPFDRTAEDFLENEELGIAIHNCLDTLKEKSRDIFRKKTLEGHDTKALCNEYKITASNLWVIIHRARKSMAECLEKNWL